LYFSASASKPLRRVLAAIQHHVFAGFSQFRGDIVVKRELARVDDAHVHAGFDRVIEKHGVHRLSHRLVAAEGER
jgi:hypothetical protein